MPRPLCEVRVYSRRHRFAGTLDVLGHWPDRPVGILLDYKTGDPGDVAADLQTAAYEIALLEMLANSEAPDALTFDALTHTYWLDGVRIPSVTQILQRAGLIDFSRIPAPILSAARDRGAAVHQAVHYYNEHDLDLEAFQKDFPNYWPFLEAWLAFRRDTGFIVATDDELPTFTHIERYAVRLMKTGRAAVEPYRNVRDYREFLALLQAQQIRERRRPLIETETELIEVS
jgi:hypothetical protein